MKRSASLLTLLAFLFAACASSSAPPPRYAGEDDDDDDDASDERGSGREPGNEGGNGATEPPDEVASTPPEEPPEEPEPAVDPVAGMKPKKGPSGYGMLVVPDLTGMTFEQAERALRASGFKFEKLGTSDYACAQHDDSKLAKVGAVCGQEPLAGSERLPKLMQVKVTLERDTFDRGDVGGANEWRRMPAVDGQSLAAARAALAQAGLAADQFEVIEVSESGCATGKVCRTEPAAGGRKVLARKGQLYVGKAKR